MRGKQIVWLKMPIVGGIEIFENCRENKVLNPRGGNFMGSRPGLVVTLEFRYEREFKLVCSSYEVSLKGEWNQ